jgi:hypothetical protein
MIVAELRSKEMQYLQKSYSVRATEDIEYGQGRTGFRCGNVSMTGRPLLLDIYAPGESSGKPRPALILAFGGAFQRGTRKNDVVGTPKHIHS